MMPSLALAGRFMHSTIDLVTNATDVARTRNSSFDWRTSCECATVTRSRAWLGFRWNLRNPLFAHLNFPSTSYKHPYKSSWPSNRQLPARRCRLAICVAGEHSLQPAWITLQSRSSSSFRSDQANFAPTSHQTTPAASSGQRYLESLL